MNRTWKIVILLLILAVCAGCDLSTKHLAKQHLKYAPAKTIIENYVELRYTENDAIAFSMLKSIDLPLRNVIIYITSLIAFIILGVITWQSRRESLLWQAALMFILAGAVGNLLDRILNGYVVDFIHVHYADKFSWPIFNVADITITLGAITLAILMLRKSSAEEMAEGQILADDGGAE